jgi:hypothetical protein
MVAVPIPLVHVVLSSTTGLWIGANVICSPKTHKSQIVKPDLKFPIFLLITWFPVNGNVIEALYEL